MYAECIEGTQRTYPSPKLVHVSELSVLSEVEGEGRLWVWLAGQEYSGLLGCRKGGTAQLVLTSDVTMWGFSLLFIKV